MTGSNRRPPACKAGALPAELILQYGDPYGIRTRVTAVKGRCLNRLTNGPILEMNQNKKPKGLSLATSYSHRGKPPTTIGAEELNFRVRNGNGCDLFAIITRLYLLEGLFLQN
jgi:hypothetical protein